MATENKKILIRRGSGDIPSDVQQGELLLKTDTDGIATNKVFIGTGTGTSKAIANLTDMGVEATNTELNYVRNASSNIQSQLDAKAALSGADFTGSVTVQAPSAGSNPATKTYVDNQIANVNSFSGVTANNDELNLLAGVSESLTTAEISTLVGSDTTTTLQAQIDNISDQKEWSLVQEINLTDVNSKVIDSTALGESYDNANYDYKFVIDGYTNAAEGSIEPYFRFDQNSTAGKYSYITQLTRVSGTSNTAATTLLANSGASGDKIVTGLDVTSAGSQGNMTVLQLEAVVTRSMATSGGGYYGYNLKGSGSVVATEGTQTLSSTYSLSAISQFTGGYGQAGLNLTSVDILDLPNAGSSDLAKIRIYKRQR